VYLIDVGQSLDIVDENALFLLRLDIKNVNTFFARMDIPTVSNIQILEFIWVLTLKRFPFQFQSSSALCSEDSKQLRRFSAFQKF
jgi:serine/threonine-protein kinase RIO1